MLLGLILILLGYCSLYLATKIVSAIEPNIRALSLTIEDIIVASLSGLSLILIIFKIFKIVPTLSSISTVTIALIIITVLLILIRVKLSKTKIRLQQLNLPNIQQPRLKYFSLSICIFTLYLLRALFKAKDFSETIYISSRYNTDIFLYLRRISVFLSAPVALQHQYDNVSAIDVLYDSPKLLSSLIYAIFTSIFNHPGVAGTVLTSLILTAIVLKYILLTQNLYYYSKFFSLSLAVYLFFQPALSWLQDQFYLSNLLYLYLLIYVGEDLLVTKCTNKTTLKFSLVAIAISSFYPSQLPFLLLAIALLILLTKQKISLKINKIIKIFAISVITFLIFLPQYLATSEVTQHFNLTDSQHGVNFVYIPVWSLLNLVPRPGGFKVSLESILLVIFSIAIATIITNYLAKRFSTIAKHLYLSNFLYIIYSLSFIIFPGSYRQGKFLVTYIIPLIIFCAIQIIMQSKTKKITTVIVILLAIYVGWNSLDRKYKSHLSQDVRQTIEYLREQNKPVITYYNGRDYRFYYLSYQLRKLPLNMISHCPSTKELENNTKSNTIVVMSNGCHKVNPDKVQNEIIPLNL